MTLQLFEGVQDVFSRLTAVCCMLLHHNPYRLPQHYKRQVCGPTCGCKRWYLWVSLNFEHYFCVNYMGTVCHWQPFWSGKSFCFIGQCWYFNPQWTPEWAIIKEHIVTTVLVSWKKCAVNKCLRVYRYLWRGYSLAPEWKRDLHGYCSITSHSSLPSTSEQIASKLQHTICDVLLSRSAIQVLTAWHL